VTRELAQVRGILADQVVVSSLWDPYFSLKALASYSNLSIRRLRALLEDPRHPLPCFRIGGKILVKRSDYDAWAVHYRRAGRADVDQVVAGVLDSLR
jgi:hypothetical protein